ncbi:cell cycle checkpoint protein RAD17 [Chelonus insularis]|uniref:cell cycle checkpoint protein RAD17 n=1 Tax=Chelonus insularis TaxID=460826 RepID=UPI001588DA36|nr:cell cycle checkpoint protein RAD17 [Chelonus insularis]
MPPIKKMKSDSGWADLTAYFTKDNDNSTYKNNMKQSSTSSTSTKSISIKHDIYNMSNNFNRKKNQINSIATLLEACDPKKSSELAVSKQKQNEITNWLVNKTMEGVPAILVLTGPSGSGKTVALKVLAKENKFDVIEWITPSDSGIAGENYMSTRQADKFFEFLIRTTRYNSVLQTCGQLSRRLLLIKDIPNVFFYDKESFYELLTKYFELGKEPLVFVCPDSEASRVYQTLFPAEIIQRFDIDTINVKETTANAMKNMLKRVATILNSKGNQILEITQDHIDEVLSNTVGDVRSTILNIIFASLKVPNSISKSNCEVREESLGLLHGIGRVINPKRVPDGDSWKFVYNPDDIASHFPSQATTFLRFLHENYLNTMSNIDHVATSANILSLSDVIAREWQDLNLIKLNLSLCIRGIMVPNDSPVQKWNPVRKPRSEESKLQRDLGLAEERFYKTIIRPKTTENIPVLEFPIEAVDD